MVMVPSVFVAVLVIILGTYYALVVRPENEQQRQLRKRLKTAARTNIARAALVKKIERLSSVDFVEALLRHGSRVVKPIQQILDQAGFRMTVGTFVLATACAAAIPVAAGSIARISAPVSTSASCHLPSASSGMNSMNRTT